MDRIKDISNFKEFDYSEEEVSFSYIKYTIKTKSDIKRENRDSTIDALSYKNREIIEDDIVITKLYTEKLKTLNYNDIDDVYDNLISYIDTISDNINYIKSFSNIDLSKINELDYFKEISFKISMINNHTLSSSRGASPNTTILVGNNVYNFLLSLSIQTINNIKIRKCNIDPDKIIFSRNSSQMGTGLNFLIDTKNKKYAYNSIDIDTCFNWFKLENYPI
jgi:hypothetical protein